MSLQICKQLLCATQASVTYSSSEKGQIDQIRPSGEYIIKLKQITFMKDWKTCINSIVNAC
jgi:hypothetical protein